MFGNCVKYVFNIIEILVGAGLVISVIFEQFYYIHTWALIDSLRKIWKEWEDATKVIGEDGNNVTENN